MKTLIKRLLRKLGYEIRHLQPQSTRSNGYILMEYRKGDGSFDYEKYRRSKEDGKNSKLDQTWVIESNSKFLGDYIQKRISTGSFGICHGTRSGNEQKWLREALQCEVIGTEISDSATQFPHTIKWDFHQANPDWISKADFIYSNSFDHSYDPQSCLNTWIDSLRAVSG